LLIQSSFAVVWNVQVGTEYLSTTEAIPPWGTAISQNQPLMHGNIFFPPSLKINVNDTVQFSFAKNLHTVTYTPEFNFQGVPPGLQGPGCGHYCRTGALTALSDLLGPYNLPLAMTFNGTTAISSGGRCIRSEDPEDCPFGGPFNVTFQATGTFNFTCMIHAPFMVMSIVVLTSDQSVPLTPAQVSSAAQLQLAAFQQVAQITDTTVVMPIATATPKPIAFYPDGTRIWWLRAGIDFPVLNFSFISFVTIPRFFPNVLNIKAKDWVFVNVSSIDAHTFTIDGNNLPGGSIVPPGAPPNDFFSANTTLFGSSPMTIPVTGLVFDSTKISFVNSGIMFPLAAGMGTSSFLIQFVQPGTYNYACALHDAYGMLGKIIVSSASSIAALSVMSVMMMLMVFFAF